MQIRRSFFLAAAISSISGALLVQACGSDEDAVITGQDTDGGNDGTTSSSGGSSSGSVNPPTDGGGADALGDSAQATPLCNVDGGFGCVAPETCDPALGCVECSNNTQCAAGALK